MGKNQHGAWGENLVVKVPLGTIVIDDDNDEVIADLTVAGQEVVVARGGSRRTGQLPFCDVYPEGAFYG